MLRTITVVNEHDVAHDAIGKVSPYHSANNRRELARTPSAVETSDLSNLVETIAKEALETAWVS
jgi:hypothetical protein